jgi:hypothetical protein
MTAEQFLAFLVWSLGGIACAAVAVWFGRREDRRNDRIAELDRRAGSSPRR